MGGDGDGHHDGLRHMIMLIVVCGLDVGGWSIWSRDEEWIGRDGVKLRERERGTGGG